MEALDNDLEEWFGKFCGALFRSNVGRLFLENMANDVRNRRVKETLVLQFLHDIRSDCEAPVDGEEALEVVRSVLGKQPETYMCRSASKELSGDYSSIQLAGGFFAFYVDNSKSLVIGDGSGDGHVHGGVINNALGELNETPEDFLRLPISTESKYALWVTQKALIDDIREQHPDDLADQLRDRLGLQHHDDQQGAHYIELVLNNRASAKPPTFLDGGINPVYLSASNSDDWGHAVRLSSEDRGLPEAVNPPTEVAEAIEFRYAGRLGPEPLPEKFLTPSQKLDALIDDILTHLGITRAVCD